MDWVGFRLDCIGLNRYKDDVSPPSSFAGLRKDKSLEASYGGHPPHLVSQRMATPSEARHERRMVGRERFELSKA